jgi:hypothetical protein
MGVRRGLHFFLSQLARRVETLTAARHLSQRDIKTQGFELFSKLNHQW